MNPKYNIIDMKKVIAKFWVMAQTENGKVIKPGFYEEKEAILLHWGVTYEELNNGVGQYTVVFVALNDGTVHEIHPSNIRFVNEQNNKEDGTR